LDNALGGDELVSPARKRLHDTRLTRTATATSSTRSHHGATCTRCSWGALWRNTMRMAKGRARTKRCRKSLFTGACTGGIPLTRGLQQLAMPGHLLVRQRIKRCPEHSHRIWTHMTTRRPARLLPVEAALARIRPMICPGRCCILIASSLDTEANPRCLLKQKQDQHILSPVTTAG
jgi:hypothetical protein